MPTSNTEVVLSFSEPLRPGGDDPRNFVITCFDPFTQSACPDLVVAAAELTMLDTQIVLTTLPQGPGLEYTVTIVDRCGSPPERGNCVQDLQENAIDPDGNTALFLGLDRGPPTLASAISLGPDPSAPEDRARVLLRFSEPVLAGAEETGSYTIDAPDLDIIAAELSPDGLTVVLTTEDQANVEYVVRVAGVRSRASGYFIDPDRSTAAFFGIPPVDTTPPRVASAVSAGVTSVIVSFSEPVLPGAADPVHYEITCREPVTDEVCDGLTVTAAELTAFGTRVLLTTTPQTAGFEYTVTVDGDADDCGGPQSRCVADLQENTIDPAANSGVFVFDGGPVFSDELPRVVGAISTGNRTVVLQFSRPMSDSALVGSNYFIVQENVNPEVGALTIVSRCVGVAKRCVGGANDGSSCLPEPIQPDPDFDECPDEDTDDDGDPDDIGICTDLCDETDECQGGLCEGVVFLGTDRLAVEIKTLSQSEVTYSITAINVTDRAGHPIAEPRIGPGGVVIDPRTTTFPGTPPSGADFTDSDGDGLSDDVEQRGWVVRVELANGAVIEREVTGDSFSTDTDGDGLLDSEELAIGSDPRSRDTDADGLDDELEYNEIYSDQNDQDTDDDGLSDGLEVDLFRTNAILADSDGDGFDDGEELLELNRDPRVADLPEPTFDVGQISLRIDERFTFVDEEGETRSEESSTTSTFDRSDTSQLMRAAEDVNTGAFELSADLGKDGSGGGDKSLTSILFHPSVSAEFVRTFQSSFESTVEATQAFERSLSKGLELTGTSSSTREVFGARIETFVSLENLSDVAFSITNLELTVAMLDPIDRDKLVPVATLVPDTTLTSGEPAVYTLGGLEVSRGPFLFASEQVYPSLVESLLREPRGLVLAISNYDIVDEFGRNLAFTSQFARDRSVGIMADFGDGRVERYLVAAAPVRNDAGEIVGGYGDYPGFGPKPAIPLSYVLEEVLLLPRSTVSVEPVWTGLGAIDSRPPDAVRAGRNGLSETIARGDDVQLIPVGIDGLPEDALVILAGENGVLDSVVAAGDVEAVVTGFSTTRTCNADTAPSIMAGPNGTADTVRAEGSDDDQEATGGGLARSAVVVLPGDNGFIDTAAAGDDVFVGPGVPCDDDSDCPGGACDGQEMLYRLEDREFGDFKRFWVVLVGDDEQLVTDFDELVLRPGDIINFGFVQDRDRDGIIARKEFLFGSSDRGQDSDNDGLDDFSEIQVGWEIQVAGSPIRRVFPDPRLADSDFDGLSDYEEQDFRRAQCECVNPDEPADRDGPCVESDTAPPCRTGYACRNVTDLDRRRGDEFGSCGDDVTESRTDPRSRDTDGDMLTDGEEVLGVMTGAAIVDPHQVIVVGEGDNRRADAVACPEDRCTGGGINEGEPCRVDRDCGPVKVCVGGAADGESCVSDIDCSGDPRDPGLCEEADSSGVECTHEPDTGSGDICDDVQVVEPGTRGLHPSTVVVAPGHDGVLHSTTVASLTDSRCVGGTGDGEVCVDDADCGDGGTCVDTENVVIAAGDRLASTTALGDDEQVATVSDVLLLTDDFRGRVIVRPGFDGLLTGARRPIFQSVPSGDDVLALGRRRQTVDPLEMDTDGDLLPDGLEAVMGADPRNPADGRALGDADGDGLYDSVEELTGWAVSANGEPPDRVFSNPQVPDSDLDGLPDLAERQLGTHPGEDDTDGDGLSDFDELSEEQLAELERFNDIFPGYFLDGSTSLAVGTDPLREDTDGDGLSDGFEVLRGWSVRLVSGSGVDVRQVFSDPLLPDTDFDRLSDAEELYHSPPSGAGSTYCVGGERSGDRCVDDAACEGGDPTSDLDDGVCVADPTDPTDPDTDGDLRLDGDECDRPETDPDTGALASCTTDPLVDDFLVTVRYVNLSLTRGPSDAGDGTYIDLYWDLYVRRPLDAFPGSVLYNATAASCAGTFTLDCFSGQCEAEKGIDLPLDLMVPRRPLNWSALDWIVHDGNGVRMRVAPFQGFLLHGSVNESDSSCGWTCQGGALDGTDCDPTSPVDFGCPGGRCLAQQENACHLPFVRAFSYQNLQRGFWVEQITLADATGEGDCFFELLVEIQVE